MAGREPTEGARDFSSWGAEERDHEANIVVLGRRLKLTDRHILDHAPSQRAYGRIAHEVLLSGWRVPIPHLQTGRR